MKALIGALIFIVVGCGTVWSQSPNGAEARLKEKNIQLPSPSTPVANYVGAVRAVDRETQKSGVSTAPNWGGAGTDHALPNPGRVTMPSQLRWGRIH